MAAPVVLGELAANPIWGALIAQIGSRFLSPILGGGPSPGERAIGGQLAATQGVMGQLQMAAAGLPTAASRATMQQVRQQGQRAEQSFAASARKRGLVGGTPTGTSPFRAGLERIRGAEQQALTTELGAQQRAAQQQLVGLRAGALGAQERLEAADIAGQERIMRAFGSFLGRYRAEGRGDPQWEEFMSLLKSMIGFPGAGAPGAVAPGGAQPRAAGEPWRPPQSFFGGGPLTL